ncbi:helix-turn-helix transcriptional regulator [Streptomyces sp. NPDC101237]|uniref:helix-turn-helix transcriptional regulator n=1 Tax=Streptomyces sp. NPDC101237 TaxID=3366139 RepID=UPI003822545D
MAGVSTEYYTHLEQGRAARPSPEVADALARALRLDATEGEHLTDLLVRPGARRAPVSPQRVRQGLHLLPRTLDHMPAYVIGRPTDVLTSNRLARAVLTDFDALPVPCRNLARYSFVDPQARERVGGWEQVACETVAMLRLEAGRCPGHRRLADPIGELNLKSTEFGTWWNDRRVLRHTRGTRHYRHPLVSEPQFTYESRPAARRITVQQDSERQPSLGVTTTSAPWRNALVCLSTGRPRGGEPGRSAIPGRSIVRPPDGSRLPVPACRRRLAEAVRV